MSKANPKCWFHCSPQGAAFFTIEFQLPVTNHGIKVEAAQKAMLKALKYVEKQVIKDSQSMIPSEWTAKSRKEE